MKALQQRCAELYFHRRVQRCMWSPRLFWQLEQDVARTRDLTRPRVDLLELEVLLAAAAGVPSECADELNTRSPGRADFIRRSVGKGERPLLSRPV
jgi:hypothetical protein